MWYFDNLLNLGKLNNIPVDLPNGDNLTMAVKKKVEMIILNRTNIYISLSIEKLFSLEEKIKVMTSVMHNITLR